ncbi:MAG: hypothetical protein RIR26_694 [Pseudomonadota bacterium]
MKVAVIGAGLAGSEVAWTLANSYGLAVTLFEMKSSTPTPAQSEPHHFAELVCSNSLKSKSRLNPAGLLKQEMTTLGSLMMHASRHSEVPAGEALAVDRELFSGHITRELRGHPKISVVEKQVTSIDELDAEQFSAIVVATGPLTAPALAEDLRRMTGSDSLYFYDAIAPIIDGDSIDTEIAFFANRKTRTAQRDSALKEVQELSSEDGEPAGHYLNLPLNKEEYFAFVDALLAAEKVPYHDFEEPRFFNGCQPIEVLAESGPRTLSFGPMKPMGLDDPRTGRRPYAAVQLRREKLGEASYNMVGFQTRLKWPEQKRIFRMLPGLAQAEFHRMGSMHRNTYLVAPKIVQTHDLSLRCRPDVWLAGQISGVEGYVESAAHGLLVGHIIGQKLAQGRTLELPPHDTAMGCLVSHLKDSDPKHYCPMNIHWGLFSELTESFLADKSAAFPEINLPQNKKKLEKGLKRSLLATRSEELFRSWLTRIL